jgi:hypothetical protein
MKSNQFVSPNLRPFQVVKQNMYTIQYSSSRQEVWRWYWCAWAKPNGLWLNHLIIAVLCGLVSSGSSPFDGFDLAHFAKLSFISFFVCMAIFPLWPQIMFKSHPRTFTINSTGIETSIGHKSGKKSWNEIIEIQEVEDEIIFRGKNSNALIIQMRAFRDISERQQFLTSAQTWHASAGA